MRARRLIFALILAIGVSGLSTLWLKQKFAGAKKTTGHLQYVAVSQAMTAGEILHASSVHLVNWPSDMQLAGAFTSPTQIEGRTLLYPIAAGEPIQDRQLAAAGAGPGLSPKIPDGMRAISLKSDEVVGVAGYLLPGTHVDVLVTYHIAPDPDPLTATVLQDVQVLTAGQKMQPDPDGKPSTVAEVTLLVTPDDAEKVVLASSQGSVHFVLRNGSDHDHKDDSPATLAEFGKAMKQHPVAVASASPEPRHIQAPRPAAYIIEVIRGDKHSTESFQ
jgi:pilus assembly protein CpaB